MNFVNILAKFITARAHTTPVLLFFVEQVNFSLDARFDVVADRSDMARQPQPTARGITSERVDCLIYRIWICRANNSWLQTVVGLSLALTAMFLAPH